VLVRQCESVPLVFITGISGAGKSAVCEELCRRGYDAHDSDREGNAVWVHRSTGDVTANAEAADRSGDWLEEHEWRLVRSKVEALALRGKDQLVFLCGAVANENEVWDLFSRVIYLTIDEETLRRRLASRDSNDFGKAPNELEAILGWHRDHEASYRRFGALVIDATLPLRDVVDQVIEVSA
jgi:dephospho-CoA kinase